MYRADTVGLVGAVGFGAASGSYGDPFSDPVHLAAVGGATLLGATINVLRQKQKGNDLLSATIAGLLAVMCGLFLARVIAAPLVLVLPGLYGAGAVALAAASSLFGVPIVMKVLKRLDGKPDKDDK